MRLLDLYCGVGGASYGYHQAGFDEIVGIDVVPQPNYPFDFIQGDALNPPVDLTAFDLIHASPPCQRFSTSTRVPEVWPNLIPPTRTMLEGSGCPYLIENVPLAPLRRDVMLCGSMFGLDIQRHRWFELGGWSSMSAGGCNHKAWLTGRTRTVTGHAAGRSGQWNRHSRKYADLNEARELMEMPWCQRTDEITEAIPPAYTRFLGEQFLAQIKVEP